MLRQIIRDLYVDPNILAELDETQKQTLFSQMREEQVRRWQIWDKQCSKMPPKYGVRCCKKKRVSFLLGKDGEPWVWVTGDDEPLSMDGVPDDGVQKPRGLRQPRLAPNEHHSQMLHKGNDFAKRFKLASPPPSHRAIDYHAPKVPSTTNFRANVIESHEVQNQFNVNATPKVAQKIAQWERRLSEERATEMLHNISGKREPGIDEKRVANIWKDQAIRREYIPLMKHNNARLIEKEIVDWFRKHEAPKFALMRNGKFEPYFHGILSRSKAEKLLRDRAAGTYLVRLSERICAYVISYRTRDKCKHYLVTAGKYYNFFGNCQEYLRLGDLLAYHTEHPLSGTDKLLRVCPRLDDGPLKRLIVNANDY